MGYARSIDPANVFFDPSARNLKECRFVHIAESKSLNELETIPAFRKGMARVKAQQKESDNHEIEDTNRTGEIYDDTNPTDTSNYQDVNKKTLHTHYKKVPARNENGYQIQVYYIVDNILLHSIQTVKPNRFPFAILRDQHRRSSV
jgi:hypothetical protein